MRPLPPPPPPPPDRLDELRLGRPMPWKSIRAMRFFSVVMGIVMLGMVLQRALSRRPTESWPSLEDGQRLLMLALWAGTLATCRCESEIRAGRRAAWAYGWDWIQIVLLMTSLALCSSLGTPGALFLSAMAGLLLLQSVRHAWLRRRRARAAWTVALVERAFE